MSTSPAPKTPTPQTVVRWLWLAAGSLVAAFTLLFSGVWFAAAVARDSQPFEVRFDEQVDRLVVDSDVGGDVRVVGTSGDEVVVSGTTHRGLASPEHTERLRDGTLEVRSDCGAPGPIAVGMFCTIDWVIEVPEDVDVEVDGVGGTVTVVGLAGEVDVHALGGSAELQGLSGPVIVETDGGGIEAFDLTSPSVRADSAGGGIDLSFDEAPTLVSVTTAGGGTTVEVPDDDEGYAVDSAASGGSEIIDVRTDPDSDRLLKLRTSGGAITVRHSP